MPSTLDGVDLTRGELYRHGFPHELFAVLREEAPVWRHPDTPGTERIGGSFWVLSKHADVQAVSRDAARFRSYEGPSLPELAPERRGAMLVSMDPPDHTRLRRLVSAGFTPRTTAMLDAQARTWAIAIIERALEAETCNFVHEVAYQLPMHLIADIVGIPVRDREWIFEHVNQLLQSTDPRTRLDHRRRAAIESELFGYAHDLGAEKRRTPTDDVWTKLITAELAHGDGTSTRLSELELDLFFMVLTIAGSETTRNAISSGLLALFEHPDQMERMRRDPAVIPTAVEEILRWSSPVAYFRRTATEDVEIGGVPIAAGERVSVWYPSANRDAEVFADPYRFDITRTENPHVTFGGGGVHYCLGANLAKREIRVMFEELLARAGDIEVLGEPEYAVQGIGNPITLSIRDLHVRLSPR
ncbi:MAG: cytochrome P450 [Acidimicrobiia bacterium]